MIDKARDILWEDGDFLVLYKREYRPVQDDRSGDLSLQAELRSLPAAVIPPEGGACHRLDRPVLGLLVFAKTRRGLSAFGEMLRERKVRKVYWAVTEKEPPAAEGVLQHRLKKDRRANRSRVVGQGGMPAPDATGVPDVPNVPETSGGKDAELSYRVLGRTARYWMVEIELATGRHHQIRVLLGHLGCPVKGDIKYGARRTNPGGGISLFAREISFTHPFTKEKLTFTADPPADPLWDCFPREPLSPGES